MKLEGNRPLCPRYRDVILSTDHMNLESDYMSGMFARPDLLGQGMGPWRDYTKMRAKSVVEQ